MKVEREKSYFVNDGYSDDECKVNLEKGCIAGKGRRDSDSDVLIEMDYREAIKQDTVQQPFGSTTNHAHAGGRCPQLMGVKPIPEIPPDYSSAEEETPIRGATVRRTVGEAKEGAWPATGAPPLHDQPVALASEKAAL